MYDFACSTISYYHISIFPYFHITILPYYHITNHITILPSILRLPLIHILNTFKYRTTITYHIKSQLITIIAIKYLSVCVNCLGHSTIAVLTSLIAAVANRRLQHVTVASISPIITAITNQCMTTIIIIVVLIINSSSSSLNHQRCQTALPLRCR